MPVSLVEVLAFFLIEFMLNQLIRLSMLKYLCLGFSNDHFQDDTRLLRGILP